MEEWGRTNFARICFVWSRAKCRVAKEKYPRSAAWMPAIRNIGFALHPQGTGFPLTVQEQTGHKLIALRIGEGWHLQRAYLLHVIICFQNVTHLERENTRERKKKTKYVGVDKLFDALGAHYQTKQGTSVISSNNSSSRRGRGAVMHFQLHLPRRCQPTMVVGCNMLTSWSIDLCHFWYLAIRSL